MRLTEVGRDDVPLGWYGSLARRHVVLIAASVLVGLLIGIAVAAHRGRIYTATVEIIASKAPIGISAETAQPNEKPLSPTVDTEAQLLQSGAVLRPAARSLGQGHSAPGLRKAMEVIVPQGTRALVMSYRAHSAMDASLGAVAIARRYIALQSRLNRAQRRGERRRLESSLDRLLHSQRAAGDTTLVTSLERRAVRSVATALAALRASPAQPAQLASAPSIQAARPNAIIPPATGALLGLLAGASLGLFLQERRKRDRIEKRDGYPRPEWKRVAGASGDG